MTKQSWNPETGVAEYTIIYKGKNITGTAKCHEDDRDMMAEYTGLHIAESRALIALARHIRSNELRPQLNILKHLYSTMEQSKTFNKKDNNVKLVRRQICMLQKQIATLGNIIDTERINLKDYIDIKEVFYHRVRKGRES